MLALVRFPYQCTMCRWKEFIEVITTDLSLSPFDGDELSRILDLIDRFEGKR